MLRAKRYSEARDEFTKVLKGAPGHANAAKTKIWQHLVGRHARQSLLTWVGTLAIFCAAATVFVLAQVNFYSVDHPVHRWLGLTGHEIKDATTYGTITFGALLFMIAGLFLPSLQKLKAPGIELTKTVTDQVSSPSSLGISLAASAKS